MTSERSTKVTGQDIPNERAVYNKAWAILKEYANITQDNESAWHDLIQDTNQLCTEAPADVHKLAQGLTMAIIEHLEEKSKREVIS